MRFLLTLLAFVTLFATSHAGVYYRGDVNRDNAVDVSDVNLVINNILAPTSDNDADVNGDGFVDVSDVNVIVNAITSGNREVVRTNVDWVWNMDELPEIRIYVTLDEWNRLLALYDSNNKTKQYIVADMDFDMAGEHFSVEEVGLRLKGNTSRRRPEGWQGQMHQANNTDWHHVHFGINMHKWVDDKEHDVHGVHKFHLKWFKDDPAYVRELFCYNLFRDYGVWTASRSNYCRLWLHVEGDSRETYMGVYEMIEPVDGNYLKQRKDENHFGSNDGNLWKCKYVGAPANLRDPYRGDYYADDDSDDSHTYTLQTNIKNFDNAKAQLVDFQLKLAGKSDQSFKTWIAQVCDVDLFLRTLAVNVAVGMWDDYWNNGNNFYLYFSTEDLYDYKVYMIPYDYDNTLGTSSNCGVQSDSGRQNPLNWGYDNNLLVTRILSIPEYKAKYVQYLNELVDETDGLMHYNQASARIRAWQSLVQQYVYNDTGEDMYIEDRPASWGNHGEYRLLEDSRNNNFFRVKAAAIQNCNGRAAGSVYIFGNLMTGYWDENNKVEMEYSNGVYYYDFTAPANHGTVWALEERLENNDSKYIVPGTEMTPVSLDDANGVDCSEVRDRNEKSYWCDNIATGQTYRIIYDPGTRHVSIRRLTAAYSVAFIFGSVADRQWNQDNCTVYMQENNGVYSYTFKYEGGDKTWAFRVLKVNGGPWVTIADNAEVTPGCDRDAVERSSLDNNAYYYNGMTKGNYYTITLNSLTGKVSIAQANR